MNVLIVGATSGIAQATAYHFASKGMNLILAGRNVPEIDRMAADIAIRYGVRACSQPFEALDYAGHEEFLRVCTERYGTLDGILLAYGVMENQKEAEADFSKSLKMIETNYVSAVSLIQAAANAFERQRRGFIGVITSVAGDRGRQSNYIYGSTKGALSIYLQGVRNRLHRSHVDVITIKPGFVLTRMTYGQLKESPLAAKPERIARLIYKAIRKRKAVVYTPGFWFYIMLIIKCIPEAIFRRLKL